MIKFRCRNCNQKIAAQDKLSGKRVKCPKCKNVVFVPGVEQTSPVTGQSDSGDLKLSSKNSDFDLTFLDVPEKQKIPNQPISQDLVPDRTFEYVRELE